MSRNDSNFTRNSQKIPTAPPYHRASAPFIPRAQVRATPPPKRRRRGWLVALLTLMMIFAIGAGLAAFFRAPRPRSQSAASAKNQVVGQAFFTNSGYFDTTRGVPSVDDVLQINLQDIPPPAPGKSYYAWLFQDENQSSATPIALGALTVTHGVVHLTYKDPQYTNLLGVFSHILVTEDDAAQPPQNPSSDTSTWKYSAQLPQTPDPNDTLSHLSMLDHLRLLLVQDPTLARTGRPGGLVFWFLRSTGRIAGWAYSARGFRDTGGVEAMQQHFIRILDYLDGDAYVQADVPSGTPEAAPTPIGLLGSATPDMQTPLTAGYLRLISNHLSAIAHAPGVSPEKRQLANRIIGSLTKMRNCLETVRKDAKQLLSMSGTQLLSPSSDALTLLDDMMAQAFYAYVGQLDPSTADLQSGTVQIQDDIEHLATFDIMPYKP